MSERCTENLEDMEDPAPIKGKRLGTTTRVDGKLVITGGALAGCLKWRANKGKFAKRTRDQYEHTFRMFLTVCDAKARREKRRNCYTGDLTPDYIAEFFDSLTCGNGSRNNRLHNLRTLVQYLKVMQLITVAQWSVLLDGFARKPQPRALKTRVDGVRFREMLDTAEERHMTDRALLAFSLYTGGRSVDVTALKLKHLRPSLRRVDWWASKTSKREQDRVISAVLAPEMDRWLDYYMEATGFEGTADEFCLAYPEWHVLPRRKYHGKERNPDGSLAYRRRYDLVPGKAWTGHLELVVQDTLTRMGLPWHKGTGMHALRRSVALAMYEYFSQQVGSDEAGRMVQVFLDHEEITTTMEYLGIDRARDRLNKYLVADASMFDGPPEPEEAPSNVLQFPSGGSRTAAGASGRRARVRG